MAIPSDLRQAADDLDILNNLGTRITSGTVAVEDGLGYEMGFFVFSDDGEWTFEKDLG